MSQAVPSTTHGQPVQQPRPASGGGAPRGRQQGPTVDPVRVLRQHVKILVGATIAGAILGVAANYLQAMFYPVWTGRVVFEVKADLKDAASPLTLAQNEETVARTGQTESQRLVSKMVLEPAMKAPDISATKFGKEYPTVDDRVEELEKTLKTGHIRGTSNFALSWNTQDRSDIPVILNRIAYTYMDQRKTDVEEGFAGDLSKFEQKRRTLDDDIRRQGDEIQRFISTNKMTDASHAQAEIRTQTEQISRLRDEAIQELTSAKTQLLIVDTKIESGAYEDSDRREATEDYAMKALEQTMNTLEVALHAKSQRFGADHPEMKSLTVQAHSAREKYESALREMMQRNLMAMRRNLSDRASRMDAVVQQQTKDLAELGHKLNEQTQRITELDLLKERQKSLENERAELQKAIMGVDMVRMREAMLAVGMVQNAVTPREMTFPRLEYYLPLGAVLGLGLAAGIIFLREFLDQRVRQPSDLMGMPGCRFLGVIPDLSDDPTTPEHAERVVRTHPASVTAEMFRQVAGRARKSLDIEKVRTISVVAAHPAAGTTTLLSNLATSAAAAGRKVVAVDANFRRPNLAKVFGVDPEAPGFGNILMGETVQPQVVDGVAVIGAGPASARVFELLQSDKLGPAIEKLREQYDFVFLDLPPSLVAGESMVIVNACDASILVVRAMEDQRGLVGKMVGQLLDTRALLIGSVLMRPLHTAGGYFKKNAEIMAEYAKEQAKGT